MMLKLEGQLRAVHHTMRGIERLRGGTRRVGPELTNGTASQSCAAKEIEELDRHVAIEHECCRAMHVTIAALQQRVATLKRPRRPSARNKGHPHRTTPALHDKNGVAAIVSCQRAIGYGCRTPRSAFTNAHASRALLSAIATRCCKTCLTMLRERQFGFSMSPRRAFGHPIAVALNT
jgi:hypothetical protein